MKERRHCETCVQADMESNLALHAENAALREVAMAVVNSQGVEERFAAIAVLKDALEKKEGA